MCCRSTGVHPFRERFSARRSTGSRCTTNGKWRAAATDGRRAANRTRAWRPTRTCRSRTPASPSGASGATTTSKNKAPGFLFFTSHETELLLTSLEVRVSNSVCLYCTLHMSLFFLEIFIPSILKSLELIFCYTPLYSNKIGILSLIEPQHVIWLVLIHSFSPVQIVCQWYFLMKMTLPNSWLIIIIHLLDNAYFSIYTMLRWLFIHKFSLRSASSHIRTYGVYL